MNLTKEIMMQALRLLSQKLSHPVRLIVGGGGAMLLAHHFPLATADIDAIPAKGTSIEELDPLLKAVAKELNLAPDWLNPYFVTFTHVLPSDYEDRLVNILNVKNLSVDALSKEDLLIMKCFAGRLKDQTHALALIRDGASVDFVDTHIERLKTNGIPGSQEALLFLDEVMDKIE